MNARTEPCDQILLEVLICTYNAGVQRVSECLRPQRADVRYLISVQHDRDIDEASLQAIKKLREREDVSVVTLPGKGLSKNRNHALDCASGHLVLFADDDVRYVDSAFDDIINAFAAREEAIGLAFRIALPDGRLYKRYRKPGRIGRIGVFRISSIELAIRRSLVERHDVHFDERFGLKAQYPSCEEAVFVADLLDTGHPVYTETAVIVNHGAESSGKSFSSDESCRARGALMRRVFGPIGYLALVVFAFRRFRDFTGNRNIGNFLVQASIGFFAIAKSGATRAHAQQ